ncbi:MAG: pyridoxal phosphate-dependent aminotransferase [Thermotogota bacterium]
MRQALSTKVASIASSATEEVDNALKTLLREGAKDVISLGVGEPCYDTPENIKRAACEALAAGKTKYELTAGDFALREAICSKLTKENGIVAAVQDVMVTPGAKYAIYLAFQAMLEPGDRVLLLDPAWVSYEPAAQMAGAGVVRVPSSPVEGFQPDLDRVAACLDDSIRVVVVNSPCNPTGAVFPPETVRSIVRMAKDRGAYVLSDEIYERLNYGAERYSPASEFDNVITVNGFSKSYAMTGWRLGYVAAPRGILKGMLKITQHSTSCVTAFAQAGALEALTSAESASAADEMVRGFATRRSLMVERIQASGYLRCAHEPLGAFYCFPSFQSNEPSVDLAKALLEETHVATVPGSAFGSCGEGHLRLSYAASEEDIREAFARMGRFFRQRAPQKRGRAKQVGSTH